MLSSFNPSPKRTSLEDAAWQLIWPYTLSTVLGVLITVIGIAIIGLEVGVLATSETTNQYPNDFSTIGVGLWCGIPVALSGLEMITLCCFTGSIHLRAMAALIAMILAACFTALLIALDAKAVQADYTAGYFSLTDFYKPKLVATQLAFAILVLPLFLVFVGLYVTVHKLTSKYVAEQSQSFTISTQNV